MSEKNLIVIDASESVLGRVASFAAKQALLGKEVTIVNCDEAVILGRKSFVISEYNRKRARGGAILKGPNFPKSPERIMKRTVRGMLRYKRGRGHDALKRVKCYNALPSQYENSEKISLKRIIKTNSIKLSELSKLM